MITFLSCLLRYIDKSPFWSSFFAALAAALVIGAVIFYFFRVPKFVLEKEYFNNPNGDSILNFFVRNKKHFISYDGGSVHVNLLLPAALLKGNTNEIPMKEGMMTQTDAVARAGKLEGGDRLLMINGQEYCLIRGIVYLDLLPISAPNVFRIIGKFPSGTQKIYYWFSTKFGNYPYNIDSEDITGEAKVREDGWIIHLTKEKEEQLVRDLPFVDIEFR